MFKLSLNINYGFYNLVVQRMLSVCLLLVFKKIFITELNFYSIYQFRLIKSHKINKTRLANNDKFN